MKQIMPSKEVEINVLLAFQHSMASELFAKSLDRKRGIKILSRAESISEAVEAARTKAINVALISSTLKDGSLSGLRALQLIRDIRPDSRSVILLEKDESQLVTAAFRAGAKGVFSLSDGSLNSLCRCVRQINAGQIWANSIQLNQILEAFSRNAPLQVKGAKGEKLLTRREGEIVGLVEQGLTNRQVSVELGLSENTVRNHLFRIFDKLGVSNRVELSLYSSSHAKPVTPEWSDQEEGDPSASSSDISRVSAA